MNKKVIIGIVAALVIVAVIVSIVLIVGKNNTSKQTGIEVKTTAQMKEVFEKINKNCEENLPGLDVQELDISDEEMFTYQTGLKSNKNIEAAVISQPFMGSQAYLAMMVKVSEDANIEEVKKEMIDNIDMNKWICVSAEKAWATNYGNIIFLVMSDEAWGKTTYDEFKKVIEGKVGKELEREGEIEELPEIPEM